MKVIKALTLLATLINVPAMVTADMHPYMLPDNLPNGLYTVDLRKTNRTVNHIGDHTINPHSYLNDTTNQWLGGGSVARQSEKRWSKKLPDSTIHKCSPMQIDWKDYHQVRQGFNIYAKMGLTISAHHVYVYSFGSTAGYVCAGERDATIDLNEWSAVNEMMDVFCGSDSKKYHYGSKIVIKDWQRQYGRTNKGGAICGKGRPGPEICPHREELCHGPPAHY